MQNVCIFWLFCETRNDPDLVQAFQRNGGLNQILRYI